MADDWEDEEFEVPDFTAKAKKADDDEDEGSNNAATKTTAGATSKQSEAAAKKAREEEIKLANKLKFAQLDSLTPEQRKVREREMVEEADVRLAGELFGGSVHSGAEGDDVSRGFGSIPVKTKQDHINFAILCAGKMEESTPFNVLAFYREITDTVKSKLTLEGLDEIIKSLTAARDEKKRTSATSSKTVKKSKAQMKEEQRKHDDIFGGTDDYGGDSRYDEDDFM
jgi:hypothetical protein